MTDSLPVAELRRQFPALARMQGKAPVAYFDGPAGTQVPQRVADAVANCLLHHNANRGGGFATSQEAESLIADAHCAAADLVGAASSDEIVFGQNMTSLTWHFSRSIASEWKSGDEIVVTHLDHDANVTPWVRVAEERGAVVRRWDFRPEDCTLDVEALKPLLSPRTKFLAMGLASNAVGSIHPVAEAARLAREVGALTFVDAVHACPHVPVDVNRLGCDFLACSAYKFFGPHQGIVWGRRTHLERLRPDKLRPVHNDIPDRWMTGTQSHEGLAGVAAAIDYLAGVGRGLSDRPPSQRRPVLIAAMEGIAEYERRLSAHFLAGVAKNPDLRVWGVSDPAQLHRRVPTFAVTHARRKPKELAERLAAVGIYTWAGNFYAIPFTERLGLEPDGVLRIGFMHYNTTQEIDRLLAALAGM